MTEDSLTNHSKQPNGTPTREHKAMINRVELYAVGFVAELPSQAVCLNLIVEQNG